MTVLNSSTARHALRLLAALAAVVIVIVPLRAILAKPNDISILPSLQVDSAAYDQIARDIARTRSLNEIPPLQPPGFVTTPAAVHALAGPSWLAAKVFLWAMFLLCVVLTARLGARVGGSERLAVRTVLYFCGILRDGWNVPRRGAVWLARATAGLMPLEIAAAVARGGALAVLFIMALARASASRKRLADRAPWCC